MFQKIKYLPKVVYSYRNKSINSNLHSLLKSMPKEPKHVQEIQNQRIKNKQKTAKYVPSRVTLQVLGTGAKGTPRSLYIFSDQTRYLFNCGEGTQRLAHELKLKLSKLEHVFVTQSCWKNIGGLPGLSLTVQDVGVPSIDIHGPDGMEELFVAARKFVVLQNLKLKFPQLRNNQIFEDNVMKVRYVALNGKSKSKGKADTVFCYICHLQTRPGALDLEKCVKAGITPGPLLGKLKSGENVTLPNGQTVLSKDVCEPDDPGPVFIVVDCPSEEYLDSLLNNEVFRKHQRFATDDNDNAFVVVHFSPSEIINNVRYQSWIEQFSPSTQHLILNDGNTCMGSMSVHRIQYKLNMVHPTIFPLLGDKGTDIVDNEDNDNNKNEDLRMKVNTLTSVHLRPRKGLERSDEVKLKPQEYIDETLALGGLSEQLDALKTMLESEELTSNSEDYPKILFLGTGSCIPNKTRNTSGILLETGCHGKLLLDCGEGTYGQMVRFFGKDKSDEILSKLNAIYVSHIHADHHIGTIGMLQGRRRALKSLNLPHRPLILLGPTELQNWLMFYNQYIERIRDEYEFISNQDLIFKRRELDLDKYTALTSSLNIENISTCLVKHCKNAYGVSVTLPSGSKITYSGDTMPCNDLVILGENSDLLIHEATMEDELDYEAVIKLHSTTTQAIDIGKKMAAKYIILTHFSQRYAKLPRLNENFADNVGIAFDNMQVTLQDLKLLPKFHSVLKAMFAEHYDELEIKALKRQLRNERDQEMTEKLKQQKIR